MCWPLAVMAPYIAAAAAVGGTAYSIDQGNKQTAFQNKVTEQNADAANKANAANYKLQNKLLNEQELQENEQAALLKHQQKLGVQREVATQRVASGEAGVSGLSIDSIFADVVRQGANNMTTVDRNLADSDSQREVERQVLHNNAIAGIQSTATYKGSNAGLGAGLQIIGSGLSAYSNAGGKFGTTSTKPPAFKANGQLGFRTGNGPGR